VWGLVVWRTLFASLLAACLSFAASAQLQQPSLSSGQLKSRPPNQKSESPQQQTTPDQRGTEQSPFFVKIVPTAQSDQQSDQPKPARKAEAPDQGWSDSLWPWAASLSTGDKIAGITAFVGFLQFIALYLTVGVMRRSARQQSRAYISAQPNFITSFDETHWPIARFLIRNLGDTPAYRVSHRALIEAFPNPLPKRFKLPRITGEWSAPVVLFPDVPLTGTKNRGTFFSAAQLEGIRNRSLSIYIFGEAKYRDAFRKRRWLEFCARVEIQSNANLIALSSNSTATFDDITYAVAPVGNDAN